MNCYSDISWLGPLSFPQEGSEKLIFSHRGVIAGQTENTQDWTGLHSAAGTQEEADRNDTAHFCIAACSLGESVHLW